MGNESAVCSKWEILTSAPQQRQVFRLGPSHPFVKPRQVGAHFVEVSLRVFHRGSQFSGAGAP
jgi:hypothetical protein